MLFPPGMPRSKRVLDLFASVVGLIVIAPLLALLALLVRLYLGTPILFRQPRAGYRRQIFHIYKFRTMTDARTVEGELLPDTQRVTRLGNFLRASSLDELPELINILRGEMSLVGPRPLLEEYTRLYSSEQAARHEVYPGLTGWAQVNGRNALTWEDKFKLDVWYVRHWSFWLDLKVIWLTPWVVLRRQGVNQPGRTTVDKFTGSN
jgi:lipopolysaccharide/colanic/teichoic acid biosynthesis glycosyltransferase